jgi:HemY protein
MVAEGPPAGQELAEVLRLVRSLDKHKALHPALSARLRELAYDACCPTRATTPNRCARVGDGAGGRPHQALRRLRAPPPRFNARGLHDEARVVAKNRWLPSWDERVVRAYREAAAPAGSAALLARSSIAKMAACAPADDAELALTSARCA